MEDTPEIYKEDIEKADVILKVLKDKGTVRDIRGIFSSQLEEIEDYQDHIVSFTAYSPGRRSKKIYALLLFAHEDFISAKTKDDTLFFKLKHVEDMKLMTVDEVERYGRVEA
ncbi:MAG TPA: hypothetical protein VMY59_03580 [Candidatus Thermoplasmatota archaeon]|nr:hypothetical protein [Candidatus Thermoplasmatota archaeon]